MHVSLRPTGADPGRILGAEDGREEALLLQGVLHWGHVYTFAQCLRRAG